MAWAILVLLLTRETANKSLYGEISHKDKEDLSLLIQSRQVGCLTITRLNFHKNGVSIDLGTSLNKAVSN